MKINTIIFFILILTQSCEITRSKQMTYSEFVKFTKSTKMVNNQYRDKLQCVDAVLIYNTIYSYELGKITLFDNFNQEFSANGIQDCLNQLDCEISVGMGYYCKEFDLVIGVGIFGKNSCIEIEDQYFEMLKTSRLGG